MDDAAQTSELPSWGVAPPTIGWRLDAFARIVLALVATPVFVATAVALQQFHFVALLVLVLVIIAFLGTGERLLTRFPGLASVKMIGGTLRITHDLDVFYREHRPRTFLLYAFYPLYAGIGLVASPIVRRELKLHARVVAIVIVLLALDAGATYGSTYPPYLGLAEAGQLVALQLIALLFLALIYLMPMTTTVYSLALSGKRRTVRALVLVSLLLSALSGFGAYQKTLEAVPAIEQTRLRARLRTIEFRADLGDVAEMFLVHAVAKEWLREAPDVPTIDSKATPKLRTVLRGLLPGVEERAFSVITFDRKGKTWTGIRMVLGIRGWLLFLRAPDGRFLRRWKDVPDDVRDRFGVGYTVAGAKMGVAVAKMGLIDDLASTF